jgi:hypothetical protein
MFRNCEVFAYKINFAIIYVVINENKIPYPTIAELNLGASPAIDAIAPAVIIGAIPASNIETRADVEFHPNSLIIKFAIIGATTNLINNEILNGFISCPGSFNCN